MLIRSVIFSSVLSGAWAIAFAEKIRLKNNSINCFTNRGVGINKYKVRDSYSVTFEVKYRDDI